MRLATAGRIISSCLGPAKDETEASRDRAAAPMNGFVTAGFGGVGVSGVEVGLAADVLLLLLLKNKSVETDVASCDGRDDLTVGSIEGVKAEGVDGANGFSIVSSKA